MSTITKWGPHAARFTLGLLFFLPGSSHFLGFLPEPDMPGGAAGAFLAGLAASGYLMPLVKLVETVAGAALLANRFVPLALVLLSPIIVNIAAFHVLLAPSYPIPAAMVGLALYLAWVHRRAFLPMLRMHNEPSA